MTEEKQAVMGKEPAVRGEETIVKGALVKRGQVRRRGCTAGQVWTPAAERDSPTWTKLKGWMAMAPPLGAWRQQLLRWYLRFGLKEPKRCHLGECRTFPHLW